MIKPEQLDAMFSGIIGQEYDMLKLICPAAANMSQLVGQQVGQFQPLTKSDLNVVELGCGTGITTLAMLTVRTDILINTIDNEPVMLNQAQSNLEKWRQSGHINFILDDALSALQTMPDNSVDIVASAYTLHNFLHDYRDRVIEQCFRVLKPGGQLINGDRYGLDKISEHTRMIQQEVSGYFAVFTQISRMDLLEHWIVHLFSDESENHVMREQVALKQMQECGFADITLSNRDQVNALVKANKPL